jgi:hypothetical protein
VSFRFAVRAGTRSGRFGFSTSGTLSIARPAAQIMAAWLDEFEDVASALAESLSC